MKFVLFLLILSFLGICLTKSNVEYRTRQKRKAPLDTLRSTLDVGSFVISTSLDIASFVTGEEQHSEIVAKLDSIKDILHQILGTISLTNAQLTTILHKLLQSTYVMSIATNEREIKHCFDSLKTFVEYPNSQQSIDNMISCTSIMKNVREIARILGGQKVGLSSHGLFDMLILEHKHCNGTEITDIHSYLKQLLLQGCASVVTAEFLKYGNTSSQYMLHCKAAFNRTDAYMDSLYRECSTEKCDVVRTNMNNTLKEINTDAEAHKALSKQFPWFFFTIIETKECEKKCFHENLHKSKTRNFFNLQTFNGRGTLFLVIYLDKRYTSHENGKAEGFELPRSCIKGYINDLNIKIFDVPISDSITFYMYQNSSVPFAANICEGEKTYCKSRSNSVRSIHHKVAITITICLVTVFKQFL